MKKLWLFVGACTLVLGLSAMNAQARPQYKMIIDGLDAETDAEKEVQAAVKKDKCNYCHEKKSKKKRLGYGLKLHDALGGGDKKDFKYDKEFWKKGDGFSDDAIKMLRKAIEDAAQEKKE